jgi:hypothetical protein
LGKWEEGRGEVEGCELLHAFWGEEIRRGRWVGTYVVLLLEGRKRNVR